MTEDVLPALDPERLEIEEYTEYWKPNYWAEYEMEETTIQVDGDSVDDVLLFIRKDVFEMQSEIEAGEKR